ncbi:MAG TPA: GGDEF domain-containing protein [Clostridia bacterium]|nr:GGDEF domain-containing protein [Clostridia bacterium]
MDTALRENRIMSKNMPVNALQGLNLDFAAMDKGMGEEFMEILKNESIRTVFQPIISLKSGELLGYEALSRGPDNSVFKNPEKLFDFARAYGRLWDLELLCRIKALENYSKYSSPSLIFLNVDPHIIDDEKFRKGFTKDFLREFKINPENVVFEITEKNSVIDITNFKKVINNYKDQGYKIAIDDAGSGYSGLKLIADIHPHYIKLDMNLIRDIDKDGLKYTLIKTLYDFCVITDIKLIAEGIETENELNSLIEIGIDYGQGYLIRKPSEDLPQIGEELIGYLKARNTRKKEMYLSKPDSVYVGNICRMTPVVGTKSTGADVLELFNSNPSLHGIPVVENDKLCGLIMKEKFFAKLGTQYGFALYINRPVGILMDNRPLTVDYETTIDNVSKMAMVRLDENLYDYMIVTRESRYIGIVTVKDLLEKMTELEVNYARHLNPLSGLPGNILIERRLNEAISSGSPFTILYIDINNFKAYNDTYGFEKGDMVLQSFAELLKECTDSEYLNNSFVGHIGGDDFIVILESYDTEAFCRRFIEAFEKRIPGFYASEDIKKGHVMTPNRHGELEAFGLIGLSIAGVSNRERIFTDVFELSEFSSKIKRKCKEEKRSCYFII